MEEYTFKNPYILLVFPIIGLASVFLFYPQINSMPWISAFPVCIVFTGLFLFYRKITFRIKIDDSGITIGNTDIPWANIKKGIITKQLVESGHGTNLITGISLVYFDSNNKRKIISVIPKNMNKPVAIVNSIRKRIELVPLDNPR